MAALTKDFLNTKVEPQTVIPNLFPGGVSMAAATKIYANSIVAKNAAGYAVPASADAAQVVIGRALNAVDNSAGAAGDLYVQVEQGCFDFNMAAAPNALTNADIGSLVYAQDDNTVSKTSQGGTLPVAGVFLGTYQAANSSSVRALVQMGPSLLAGNSGLSQDTFMARGVITSLAAFTGSGTGVLTGSVNGAIGTQDGLTLAVGDVVILPAVTAGAAVIAAKDVGPYVVTAVGSASAKYVLTRPSWWATGSEIPAGHPLEVYGTGTKWGGTAWKAMCAGGLVVDTGDPLLYPQVEKGTKALAAGTGSVTGLFAFTTAQPACTDTSNANALKAVLTAGYGTGTLALTGTGTDVIAFVITNF